jgi:hypothetical protein
MPVTAKTLQAIKKDQQDIQARRVAMNHDRPAENGFGEGVSLGTGKWRYINGEWHRIEEAPPITIAKSDAYNIVSNATGCTRAQVDDFNKTFGHMGVTYLPNGKAVYKDIASQERVLAARGYFNRNSNRSPKNF